MTILTEFAYFEKKSTFRTHPESPEKGMQFRKNAFQEPHAFLIGRFLSGRHVRPAAADRGHMLPSACHALRLDTCLPGRLHHDDGEKARPFPCGKRRQGRFSCLMTCRGQEANGFQQHNHFKRRRVWRIGRTTQPSHEKARSLAKRLEFGPAPFHRRSCRWRSCLAGGFSLELLFSRQDSTRAVQP